MTNWTSEFTECINAGQEASHKGLKNESEEVAVKGIADILKKTHYPDLHVHGEMLFAVYTN